MRKPLAILAALSLAFIAPAALTADPASAQQSRTTQKARVSSERNRAENSVTCRGEAKRDDVTKGALAGGLGGTLLLGGLGGAVVGAAAGAGVQHMQNNAACGR